MLQRRISPAYAETIPSPLDPAHSAILVEMRPTAPIAAAYLRDFGYDCSEDFAGLEEIAVYECSATGYRFFYPYSLEGKERLYRAIEDTDWCYDETKWEHVAVAELIPEDASVLDIGCGRGAFLSKLKTARATGIELNRSAAEFARERGIEVVQSLIAAHAQERPEAYDVVTAFQVLEHIAHPMPFLQSCLAALKPGGFFVLAVPNNDAFIRFADLPLNQPPHHVGLWNPRSVSSLAAFLPMKLKTLIEEPLRELDWYRQVMESRYVKGRWKRSLYYRLGWNKIFQSFIEDNADSISGHTLIGMFVKD